MTDLNKVNSGKDGTILFQIIRKQLDLIYAQNSKALFITLINSIILSVVIYKSVPLYILLSWQGTMFGVICLRFALIWFYHRAEEGNKSAPVWIDLYMFGTGVTGVVWGLSAILFFHELLVLQQTFMVMLIAGMMAAASAFQSILYRCFLAYIIPLSLLYIYVLLRLSANDVYPSMGLLTILYTMVMLIVGKRINRTINQSIQTRFENTELISKLQESESQFRALTETTVSGIFIIQDGKYKYGNRASEEITGYNIKELEDKPFWNIVHPDFRDLVIDRANARLNPEEEQILPNRYEFKLIRKDGIERWVDFTVSLLIYQGKKSILGTAFDITERKRVQKELTMSERRYRKLFNSANDAIFVINVNKDYSPDRFIDVNDLACNWLGYRRKELLSMTLGDIDCEKNSLTRKNLQNHMLARGQGVFEGVFLTKNQRHVSVEISAHLLPLQGTTIIMCIARDISKRKILMEELTKMANTDPLTGAFNRRQFWRHANEEMSRAKRYSHPLVLMMMDIDHFKYFNDNFGHQLGDQILSRMVQLCHDSLRKNDSFGRLGGDEFAVLLVESVMNEGLEAAERLRQGLANLIIQAEKETLGFTVSIGVAVMTDEDKELDDLIARADKALYKAKDNGRNRVEYA